MAIHFASNPDKMRIVLTACVIWFISIFRGVEGECNAVLGMQNKAIPDSSITASSHLSLNHVPSLARLDNAQGAWCSAATDNLPYVEILLGEEKFLTSIKTQGSRKELIWAGKYEIHYFKDGKWIVYRKNDGTKALDGNGGISSLHKIALQPQIRTRSIRIFPKSTHSLNGNASLTNVACLRLELYGCSAPVDGSWSAWGPWSTCSVTCGLGKRLRERFCDSPVPSNGGAPCNESERTEQEHCRLQKCIKPAVDGGWGKWGPWSACSLTCGIGLRSRERKCDSPEPRNGGVPCNRAERMQQRFCRVARCGATQGNDLGFSGSGYGWETSPDTSGSGEDKDGWTVYYGKKKQHQGFSDDEDLAVKSRPLG